MKKVAIITLLITVLVPDSAFAAKLICNVYPIGKGTELNNVHNCFARDYTKSKATSGVFYLTNITKPVEEIVWQKGAKCLGGNSCSVTVEPHNKLYGQAVILYKDGSYEKTNEANISYINDRDPFEDFKQKSQ